jgi:hypothetical protein
LKQAFENGFKNFDVLINNSDLCGVKDNPEFKALIEKCFGKGKNQEQ